METEVQDVVKTEAEGASEESSAETTSSTAKEAGTKAGDAQDKTSQATASPDDSEDKDTEKDGKVNVHAHRRIKAERNELRTWKKELAEIGIESKEHAEFLLREAQRMEEFEVSLEQRPAEFFARYQEEFPKQWNDYIEPIIGKSVSDAFHAYAAAYRKRGKEGDSEVAKLLDDLAGDVSREPERTDRERPEDGRGILAAERFEFFAEQVSSDLEAQLMGKINELTKGTEFRSEKQKAKLVKDVINDLSTEMERNPTFVRQRNAAQDPRRGLSRQQRGEVIELYMRNAQNKLERTVRDNLSLLGLPLDGKNVVSDGKPLPGRREVTGAGTTPSGEITLETKDRIKREILKEGYSGPDIMIQYGKRMAKLRGQ